MKTLIDYKFANVLVVAAHMDDEALFCGGTLRRLRDQGCELSVVVTASVTVTNQPRDPLERIENESARQQRRLIAFGRACGMLDVQSTHLLETHNCRGSYREEPESNRILIESEITERLEPLLKSLLPDVIVTHGRQGEYGHGQHILTSRVVRRLWPGSLWGFSADGPLFVEIDLSFKKRLLDCYRYGTTQDPYWTPYTDIPSESSIGPWLGSTEPFREYT